MKAVLEDFDLRVREARSFLRMLRALEDSGAQIGTSDDGMIPVQDDWRRVSKATAFLVLYNLVEAAIRSAFAHLYGQVETSGCTAAMVTDLLREVWIDQRHRLLTRETASPSNYRDTAGRIVTEVIRKTSLRLNPDKLPVSGNLDAQAIRDLCTKHGVECKSPKKARGGVDLKLVKDQRNALAHGIKSFAECGRETTVADLERIADQVESYTRAVLRSIGSFIRHRRFLVPTTHKRRTRITRSRRRQQATFDVQGNP